MPSLSGGQKFSFPTLFDFYREVLLMFFAGCKSDVKARNNTGLLISRAWIYAEKKQRNEDDRPKRKAPVTFADCAFVNSSCSSEIFRKRLMLLQITCSKNIQGRRQNLSRAVLAHWTKEIVSNL